MLRDLLLPTLSPNCLAFPDSFLPSTGSYLHRTDAEQHLPQKTHGKLEQTFVIVHQFLFLFRRQIHDFLEFRILYKFAETVQVITAHVEQLQAPFRRGTHRGDPLNAF